MKYLLLGLLFCFFNCNSFEKRKPTTVNSETSNPPLSAAEEIPIIPEGALKADFMGNNDSLYAFVKNIDAVKKTTRIAFENDLLPEITIPESMGAKLQLLKLKNFDSDVLLVNAKLKDTNFNEYYLFVWNDTLWQQPVNRFDIHKSNMTDTLVPIITDPKDSTKLLRYYSVFVMDRKSAEKFTWKLMRESVPIEE